MYELIPFFLLIVAIIAVALTVYYAKKARHIERMTLIEKGYVNTGILKSKSFAWRRLGLIAAGFGFGAIFGDLMYRLTFFDDQGLISISSIILFTGIALIVSSILEKKDKDPEAGETFFVKPPTPQPEEEKSAE